MLAAGPSISIDLAFGASMLLAVLATAVGSVVRDQVVRRFSLGAGRPDLGILAVNVAACAVAGVAAAAGALPHAAPALGLAGGLSTWSSLAVEVAVALEARRWSRVALHVPGAFAITLVAYLAARLLAGGHA